MPRRVPLSSPAAGAAARVAAPALAQLRGHGGPVRAIAVSPDGSRAVSGSFDTTAIVWSLASGTAEKVLRFHDGAVNAVVLPQGRTDGDQRRGRQHRHLAAGREQAGARAEGAHRRRSSAWPSRRTARRWPPPPGTAPRGCGRWPEAASRVLEGHQQNVNGVAFTPDGRSVVTAGYDLTLRIWPLTAASPHCRHAAGAAQRGRRCAGRRASSRQARRGKVYFLSADRRAAGRGRGGAQCRSSRSRLAGDGKLGGGLQRPRRGRRSSTAPSARWSARWWARAARVVGGVPARQPHAAHRRQRPPGPPLERADRRAHRRGRRLGPRAIRWRPTATIRARRCFGPASPATR